MQSSQEPMPDLFRLEAAAAPLWAKLLFIGLAAVFFVLGVIGWLLPVVTGVPFYIAGLVFLALASRRVRARLNRWERKLSLRHRIRLRRALLKFPVKGIRELIQFPEGLAPGPAPPDKAARAPSDSK